LSVFALFFSFFYSLSLLTFVSPILHLGGQKDGASAIAGIASTSTKHPPSPPNNGWFTALLCNRLRTLASFGPSLDLGVAAPLQV
jgi:hypothetical protein